MLYSLASCANRSCISLSLSGICPAKIAGLGVVLSQPVKLPFVIIKVGHGRVHHPWCNGRRRVGVPAVVIDAAIAPISRIESNEVGTENEVAPAIARLDRSWPKYLLRAAGCRTYRLRRRQLHRVARREQTVSSARRRSLLSPEARSHYSKRGCWHK